MRTTFEATIGGMMAQKKMSKAKVSKNIQKLTGVSKAKADKSATKFMRRRRGKKGGR